MVTWRGGSSHKPYLHTHTPQKRNNTHINTHTHTQNGNLEGKLRRLRGKAAHEFRALSDAAMDLSEAVAHALKTKAEVWYLYNIYIYIYGGDISMYHM
jgi:hypothetical protein